MSKKKKKKTFLWLIFIRLLLHALRHSSIYPQVFRLMEDFIKLRNPGRFLEDSSFGSHFRDLQNLA